MPPGTNLGDAERQRTVHVSKERQVVAEVVDGVALGTPAEIPLDAVRAPGEVVEVEPKVCRALVVADVKACAASDKPRLLNVHLHLVAAGLVCRAQGGQGWRQRVQGERGGDNATARCARSVAGGRRQPSPP